ncbi:MAG: type VI secretion system tube protein Hcp [Chloroflexi bacterium]|nr:type VI secretion system tube protein Hcp [Chloroflexota bacterium]
MSYEFYITIEGVKQGKLKGEMASGAPKDKILGLAFLYEVEAPRVASTGRTRGARKHSPVVFVKPWGPASPQLYQALITNELLKTVLFEFVQVGLDGQRVVYHTIKLYESSILSIKHEINPSKAESFPEYPAIERVALTFQRIELQNLAANTTAADEWSMTT